MIWRKPKPGWTYNPLAKHRNIPCPCQSGHKAKLCCGRFPTVPLDVAAKVTAWLKHEGYR